MSALTQAETALRAAAPDAIEAVIAAGARELICSPWRANRIIIGAEHMTAPEIEKLVNRMLPGCRDFNRTIALLQLRRAASDLSSDWSRR